MRKLDLNAVAEEFEIIGSESYLFYNKETGEFDFYSDYMDFDDDDSEKFEDDCWISAPRQMDIGEYVMMKEEPFMQFRKVAWVTDKYGVTWQPVLE